jgi:hypothetical protein
MDTSSIKFVLILPLLAAVVMFFTSRNDSEIASRQATAVGQIVAHEPDNHNRYGYKFRIDGREYTGWETPAKAEPKMGQSVTIYYDASNPDENALTDYTESGAAWSARAWCLFVIAGIAFSGASLAERRRIGVQK